MTKILLLSEELKMVTEFGWLQLRWFANQDLAQIASILRESFPQENWTESDVDRFCRSGPVERKNIAKVFSDGDDKLFGALLYSLEPMTCKIRRIAVSEVCRRQGIGCHMLHQLTGPNSQLRREVFSADVKIANSDGLAFFKSQDFVEAERVNGVVRLTAIKKKQHARLRHVAV